MKRICLAIGFLAAGVPAAPLRAQDTADRQIIAQVIPQVIETQLRAFGRNDAATAFAQAAPAIRARFGSAARFMRMVETRYLPVYRSRAVTFGRLKILRGAPVQEVFLVGPGGKLWRAFYRMERQPDGGWKILGVVLLRPKGRSL